MLRYYLLGRFSPDKLRRQKNRKKHSIAMHAALYPGKTIIVVAGYPKSGNTWLCRLLAQALDCPSAGFLTVPSTIGKKRPLEFEVEGQNRTGRPDLVVLKSHHRLDELRGMPMPRTKLVTIVRDPRDICVSGMHFMFDGKPGAAPKMLEKMQGKDESVPWVEYVGDFLENDVPIVRYEDLSANTMSTVQRIFSALGLEYQQTLLERAVHDQSFEVAKNRYKTQHDVANFMHARNGTIGEHKSALSNDMICEINREMGGAMKALGYVL